MPCCNICSIDYAGKSFILQTFLTYKQLILTHNEVKFLVQIVLAPFIFEKSFGVARFLLAPFEMRLSRRLDFGPFINWRPADFASFAKTQHKKT